MQTFLPYENFIQSASVLDRQRLGKQRVEVLQLLSVLTGMTHTKERGHLVPREVTTGWVNHPAAKMWKGYERSLSHYGRIVCIEWRQRGYVDTCEGSIGLYYGYLTETYSDEYLKRNFDPPWMGNLDFHRSHRSNLLRKDREWYEPKFEEGLSAELPYIWPVD